MPPPSPFARGFSAYGATPESFRLFLRACRKIGLTCGVITASEFRDRRFAPSRTGGPVAVFQDLPADSPRLSPLIERVIFPAWFERIPVCFVSCAGRGEYPGKDVNPDSLHADLPAIGRFLLREQLIRLLEIQGGSRPPLLSSSSALSPRVARPLPLDDDLDTSQAAAVDHAEGPIRVLAPAGSGKTKTLVNRICSLVNKGAAPGSILPLAFNTKAASEMNARLDGKGLMCIRARTFHALGYEITRSGTRLSFDAGNEGAITRALLKEALELLAPGTRAVEGDAFAHAVKLLSAGKTDLIPLENMHLTVDGGTMPFGPVFARFVRLQRERGIMNYDDMIYFALRVLIDDDTLRRRTQGEYRYILVDEYQDLNKAQNLLLRILALPENNLFVVGDDDQSIYGWRGADVRSIIDFPGVYPCARTCVLSTNYRSGARIVAHAGWLIGRNRERVDKRVVPRAGAPPGTFDVILRRGIWEEALAAAGWIEGNPGNRPWCETAVLCRYNALRFIAALALDARGIPHIGVDGGRLFASRPGRDVAAWLTILLSPDSAAGEDLARVFRRPERILPRALAGGLERWDDIKALAGSGVLAACEEELLASFLCRVDLLRSQVPSLSSRWLLAELDGALHLRESYTVRGAASPDPDDADDCTYFDVIEAASEAFPSPADFLAHIRELLFSANAAGPGAEGVPGRDEVVLRSVHRAKGNEFSRVVYFDLSRRHRPATEESEEERRVAYVALTRAKDALLITANGRRQSPFLIEAALDPRFSGRMREDMESELKEIRKRARRMEARRGESAERRKIELCVNISALEEELTCRSMLGLPPASS